MTWMDVLIGVVVGLVVNEMFDVAPRAATALVRSGAAFAYPGPRGRDRGEEWAAVLHDRPGNLFKLTTAVGLYVFALNVGLHRQAAVWLAEARHTVRHWRLAGNKPPLGTVAMLGYAWLIGGDDNDELTRIELRFEAADPYAVGIVFHDDEPVEWSFGRDLLADGLTGEAGLGDLAFFTDPAVGRSAYLWMGLSSPDGIALFAIRRRMMRRFLNRTYALVQPGAESAQLDLDAAVGRLLS